MATLSQVKRAYASAKTQDTKSKWFNIAYLNLPTAEFNRFKLWQEDRMNGVTYSLEVEHAFSTETLNFDDYESMEKQYNYFGDSATPVIAYKHENGLTYNAFTDELIEA